MGEFPKRFGKYILIERLASGGMAEVFRAKVTGVASFEREVAIKCLRHELLINRQFITMFIDEATLAGQLSHNNIAQIYELGRHRNKLYIAMELVEGRDLRDILKQVGGNQGIPVGLAAYVIAKSAEGLDYAHRKNGRDGQPLNLVHRDVSPQNILLSFEGEVKVVDFGIAKASARMSETTTGMLKGKLSYMAPEQIRGITDRRSDIFALGTVLYELITGTKLFDAETDLEVIEKVRKAQIPNLKAKFRGMAPELTQVLQKALAENPDRRFQFASEIARALEPLLIDGRSIYGARKAAEYMQGLYADIINRNELHLDDELADLNEEPDSTEIFGSAFEKPVSGEGGDDGEGFWSNPTAAYDAADVGSLSQRPPDEEERPPPGQGLGDLERKMLGRGTGLGTRQERHQQTLTPTDVSQRLSVEGSGLPYVSGWPWRFVGIIVVGVGVGIIVGLAFTKKRRQPTEPAPVTAETRIQAAPTASAATPQPAAPAPKEPKKKEKEADAFGFVSIKLTGVRGSAVIYVDGKVAGRGSSLMQRLPLGPHRIKAVEKRRGKVRRIRYGKVSVEARHTRRAPSRLVINF